uniref:Immunoglobulin domain-containing protein n=1 Tax=Cyprinus carpio TaxID=7962 RepID=A0A8C1MA85_CYPCA
MLLELCVAVQSCVYREYRSITNISKDTVVGYLSVMEGESVTLDPELTDIQSDKEIEWRFGEVRIARVLKNTTNYYGDTFTNRLKMYRNGSLTITNTRNTDSGLYKLSTIIQNKVSERRFNVTVDVSLIVLISAAAAGSLLILAAVGIFCICRKQKKTDQQGKCYLLLLHL